jgi:hypothetical protein
MRVRRAVRSPSRGREPDVLRREQEQISDADDNWVEELLAFDRQVAAEDRVLVERVQKGVRSGMLEEGRLLGESEQLVARFQELVGTALS